MTATERSHLFELANPAPTGLAGGRISADVQAVLDALDPNPACVYNSKFDLLACNSTYAAVFPELSKAPRGRRNLLWQVCASMLSGEPLGNRHMLPRIRMVAVVRANYARHAGDPDRSGWPRHFGSCRASVVTGRGRWMYRAQPSSRPVFSRSWSR